MEAVNRLLPLTSQHIQRYHEKLMKCRGGQQQCNFNSKFKVIEKDRGKKKKGAKLLIMKTGRPPKGHEEAEAGEEQQSDINKPVSLNSDVVSTTNQAKAMAALEEKGVRGSQAQTRQDPTRLGDVSNTRPLMQQQAIGQYPSINRITTPKKRKAQTTQKGAKKPRKGQTSNSSRALHQDIFA